MRRVISSRLTIVALVLMVITLITGVTWAATNPSSAPSTSNQLATSVVEITPTALYVVENGSFEVAGAGFTPGETVFFEMDLGELGFLVLQGGDANEFGAFLADATRNFQGRLPDALKPGIYTIKASTIDGHVASAPVIICSKDAGPSKCPEGVDP